MNEEKEQLEKEVQLNKEKMAQVESHNESSINELMSFNTKLLAESESLKKEINDLSKDKLELESTVDDLKRTLNLTEEESKVKKLCLDL